MSTPQGPPPEPDADAQRAARRARRILFWLVVVLLALNAALLYRVWFGPK